MIFLIPPPDKQAVDTIERFVVSIHTSCRSQIFSPTRPPYCTISRAPIFIIFSGDTGPSVSRIFWGLCQKVRGFRYLPQIIRRAGSSNRPTQLLCYKIRFSDISPVAGAYVCGDGLIYPRFCALFLAEREDSYVCLFV